MGTFTIISGTPGSQGSPVVGNNSIFLANRVDKTFTTDLFTSLTTPVFSDPNDNLPTDIKILSLPATPNLLLYNGSPVTINQEISFADITAGLLTYDSPDQDNISSNSFTFALKVGGVFTEDTGSFLVVTGSVVAPVNNPPLVSDANADLTDETYQFVLADFTNNFIDYDGDSYDKTTLESLPSIGTIMYNGSPVSVGYEFELANVNNLTFQMPETTLLSADGYCDFGENVQALISGYQSQGYTLDEKTKGILKFTKEVSTELPNNTDIYAFFDATSMKITDAQAAQQALNAWYIDFTNTYPSFTGKLYILPVMMENWLGFPAAIRRGSLAAVGNNWDRPQDDFMAFAQIPPGFDIDSDNPNGGWTPPAEVLTLAFIDEVDTGSTIPQGTTAYHRNRNGYGFDQQPSAQYLTDYKSFVEVYPDFDFFKGIFYPIADIDFGSYNNTYNACVLQGFAAIEGGATYTLAEIEALGVSFAKERRFDWHLNPAHAYYSGTDPYVANPYSKEAHTPVPGTNYELQGLKNFGWAGAYDKDQPASDVFSVQTFTDDLNSYLQGDTESYTDVQVVEGTCYSLQQLCFDFKTSDDSTANLYSKPATFCFNVSGQAGGGAGTAAPTVDDNSSKLRTKVLTFSNLSFVKNFTDADGDQAHEVIIKSLPRLGTLKSLGNDIAVGDTFLNINAGLIEYHLNENVLIENGIVYEFNTPIPDIIALYEASSYVLMNATGGKLTFQKGTSVVYVNSTIVSSSIKFDFIVTDNSVNNTQSNIATYTLIPEGTINMPSLGINQPPTVGNKVLDAQYDTMVTLYRYVFTDTDPRFQDPEGDQPYQLKILSLPQNGVLLYNSTPVVVGQIFDFVDDVDAGKLKFDPDDNLEYFYEIEFDFTVSDTGSKKFA